MGILTSSLYQWLMAELAAISASMVQRIITMPLEDSMNMKRLSAGGITPREPEENALISVLIE